MKIITMERKTMDKKPVVFGDWESGEDYREWWCVIETPEEELVYEDYLAYPYEDHLWNQMIKHAGQGELKWGEDDIYGYIRPDEVVPDVGEKYTDGDEDIWERVREISEGVKVKKLKCGIGIAMEDYWELDEQGERKDEFTFDEALEIEKKTNGEWRVPTIAEWLKIVLEVGVSDDGGYDTDNLVKTLKLTRDNFGYGCYWSSTANSSGDAYHLLYDSDTLYPTARYGRNVKRPVRCIKKYMNEGSICC